MFLGTILKDVRDQACRHILKVCIVDIEVLIHNYFYKDVQTQVSPVTVVSGGTSWDVWGPRVVSSSPAGDGWCAREAPFVLSPCREGAAQSRQHRRQILQNALWCMAPARINGTVMLSKAQINNCWHSQSTSPPFGKYHLMTELMKGPQTSNTSTIAKKSHAIYGHSSL